MKAGFFSFKDRKDKNKYSLGELVKHTKKSESKLIRNYEEMSKATSDYAKAFKDHFENLEQLDDRVNFNGMVSLFEEIIMKDTINSDKVDKSTPILFSNYKIEGDISSSSFRTEHLERQLYYLLDKYNEEKDASFIKYMSITNVTKTSCKINIITIDNKKYSKEIDHEEFILDEDTVKKILQDIIYTTKKNLKIQNNNLFNNMFNNNSKFKTHKKGKSILHNRSKKNRRNTKNKNNNNNNIQINKNNKNIEEINLLENNNNNERLRFLNNNIRNVFKKRNEIPLFSIEKTRSQKDRNVKKIANEKAAAEAKARELQYPPRQENQIAQKCAILQEQECKNTPECHFTKYQTCIKSTRPPLIPGQLPGQAPGQLPGQLPGQTPGQVNYPIPPPNLIDIPTNNTNNKKKPFLGETKI